MSRFTVTLLEESIDDIKVGKRFYEENEVGIGSYFADSAMADITSLRLYAGIHSVRLGYHRMLLKILSKVVDQAFGLATKMGSE